MKTTVSKKDVESYREKGFAMVRGFLSNEEAAELKRAVLDAVEKLGQQVVAGEGLDDHPAGDGYYSKVFTQRMNLWHINDTIKKYMLGPDLGRMMCDLAGIEGIRVWHDQTLIKEPFGNPTGWHLDNPYWSFHSHDAISIWIALDDATLENGCMWFIPGTPKMASFDNTTIDEDLAGLFKIYPEMAEIDPVPMPMTVGDCSFHNGLLAHGAGANMTRGRRVAMTCAYMPEGSTFNGQRHIIHPTPYFESLKVGDVLESEDYNPLLFSRQTVSAS